MHNEVIQKNILAIKQHADITREQVAELRELVEGYRNTIRTLQQTVANLQSQVGALQVQVYTGRATNGDNN